MLVEGGGGGFKMKISKPHKGAVQTRDEIYPFSHRFGM